MSEIKIKLRPVLDGDFWMIGDNPDLGELNGNTDPAAGYVQECVDHHVFRDIHGKWHLWGCIRGTAIGRILYHWRSDEIEAANWEKTGELFRCDRNLGESMMNWNNQEWIQSPYVVRENGIYYMFYGGHSTQWDVSGRASDAKYPDAQVRTAASKGQICVMTSPDGVQWTRYTHGPDGYTRLFTGPGETRDPMLLKIGDVWYIYVAGGVVDEKGGIVPQIYVRTSEDLYHWSDWEVAHSGNELTTGDNIAYRKMWTHECPFVAYRGGYYYLFRTEDYASQRTHVFRSENPRDFGLTDQEAAEKYVGTIAVGAPEIILNGEQEYITSNHNLVGGTMMSKLKWVEA